MMRDRYPFSALAPENKPLLRENQYIYIHSDCLNPPFRYPLQAVGSTCRRPEPMIALTLHCVPNIPVPQHSLRGLGLLGRNPKFVYYGGIERPDRRQGVERVIKSWDWIKYTVITDN